MIYLVIFGYYRSNKSRFTILAEEFNKIFPILSFFFGIRCWFLGSGILTGATILFSLVGKIHNGSHNESKAAQACGPLGILYPFPYFFRFFSQVDDHIRVLRVVDDYKMHHKRNLVNINFRSRCIHDKYFYCL
nr:MAG TPA: hypothetical protein [Caudoviricetes sp.]